MRRRAVWIGGGVAALLILAGIAAYEVSGIGRGARSFESTMRAARARGFELDPARLVRQEAALPNYRAKLQYDWALAGFARRLPKGVTPRTMTVAQRAALRSEIRRLVPLSLDAEGGSAREWRLGYLLSFPQYSPYRGATLILTLDADEARHHGDLDGAIDFLEEAESLGHGLVGDQISLSEVMLVNGSLRIGAAAGALLADPRLSRDQIERIVRILQGATFRHGNDHRVLQHELIEGWASIDTLVAEAPMRAVRSGMASERFAPLGRMKPVREAWAEAVLRPYVEADAALPSTWTEFGRYASAWEILARSTATKNGFAGFYARILLPLRSSNYARAQMRREAARRVVLYAADLRLGRAGSIPRDPFSSGSLRVHTEGGRTTIYSIGPDRNDDGGMKMTGLKGDFAVTIPR